MANSRGARTILATVIGWVVVALVVWFLFGALVGTILWILRTILIIAVILGLITLYFKLKSPKE